MHFLAFDFVYAQDGLVNRVWPEASALDWELDVLFFEGNVGSRSQLSCRDTWLQRNQPNVFWPQEWLPKDVKRNIRVSVLDYTISWETNGLKELIEDMKDYWLFRFEAEDLWDAFSLQDC